MFFLDYSVYLGRYEMTDGLSLTDAVADICAADVDKRRADDTHTRRQVLLINDRTTPGIDHDVVIGKDFVVFMPFPESLPVVAADEKGELPVREIVSQCLPYIGYPRSLNALTCVNNAAKQFE